jgi:hypothetical protein
MSAINLLVLRCNDVVRSRAFFECFGLEFVTRMVGEWK